MNGGQQDLSLAAGGLLIVIGGIADVTKLGLEAAFGIGIILDPVLISPVTALTFWVILQHNGIPMFSGKRSVSGWTNLVFAEAPVVDALPDWTVYAIYLTVAPRVVHAMRKQPEQLPQ